MKIKRDPLDILFMKYLRLRDKVCQRCGSQGKYLQVSHFWGRRMRSVRWDDDNCDLLCFGCHQFFSSNPALYRDWKLQKLGRTAYDLLEVRASRPSKVDKEAIRLYLQERIKCLK